MRLKRSALVIAIAAALLNVPIAASTGVASATPAAPKVMIVGDSVAHQFDGDYTWRYRLAMEFRRQHAPVNLVGPFKWAYGSYHHYLATGWDSDHDAQGATLIKDYMDISPQPGAPNWGRYDIVPTMRTYKPDVIVTVMANNDVNNDLTGYNYGYPSIHESIKQTGRADNEVRVAQVINDVLADYKAFIASARQVKPNVKIVIGDVTSQAIEPWVRDEVNAAFASQITSTSTSPVVVARTDDPLWAKPGYTVDGIHPTPTGDMLMAQRIAQGLKKVWPALLPANPAIPQVKIAWNPVLKPTITVAKGQITVNWGVAARSNTVLGIRLKFVRMATRAATYATYVQTSSWTSPTLKPGSYRVRLQGIRGNMTSTWSPAYSVSVPAS